MRKIAISNHPTMSKLFVSENNPPSFSGLPISSTKSVRWKCLNTCCPCHHSGFIRSPRQIRDGLKACPEARGCRECAYRIRGARRRQKTVQKNGSLLEHHPHLAAEWLADRNKGLLPSQMSAAGGRDQGGWRCKNGIVDQESSPRGQECGYVWFATVRDRLAGSGCMQCYRRNMWTTGFHLSDLSHMARSVIAGDEKLAAEYDVARNGPLEQKNITMNQPISWRCQRYADHPPWEATLKDRIADRLDGNLIVRSCPRCACTSNPRIQRALTQMITSTLGINVEEGLKISGYFPDAYLPDYRTILEYDGPYHCPIKDKLKDRLWISEGYRVFRLRDGSLPDYKNTGATVRDTPELAIESFAECATNLGSLLLQLPLQSKEQRLISKLANGRLLTREQIFQFKAIPSFALPSKSAAEMEPWLLRYASPRNLYPLTNYTKSANVSYLWLCPICAHEYPLSIANRVRNFVCKKCWSVFKTSPQKEAIKAWIKNSEKPRQVPPKLLSL